jgi:type I restriction enzyme S subunit
VRKQTDGDVGSTAFCVLRSNGSVEPGYLFRWTLTKEFSEGLVPKQRGISYPAVRDTDVLAEAIPLAPLAEQQRIVAKIEALFEQSRTARQAVERIPSLLKKFRQAVLAAAFRGDLTRDWREQHPDIELASGLLKRVPAKGTHRRKAGVGEIGAADRSDLWDLPHSWIWANLGQILDLAQYGTSVKASASIRGGIPILRMGNIQDGRLDFRDLKYIDTQYEDMAKYTLQRGDVLINRTNSPELVGKAALFDHEGTHLFASYLIRLRPYPDMASSAFMNFVINSHIGRRHVQEVKHQVAGQANINTSDIRSMPIPLPPLEEQKEVATRIEGLFARTDAIQASVEAARQQADKLEQSILARSFRGELVPQDPNDEPASTLLDRIRASHAGDNAGKWTRNNGPRKRKHGAARRMART